MHKSLRAGRLAVVAGAAVGLAAIGSGSAFAASAAAASTAKPATTATASVLAGFGQVTLAPGGLGKTVGLNLYGSASAVTTFQGITVQIDFSALAGIATVTPQSSACTTAGTIITCTAPAFKASIPGDTSQGAVPFSGQESIPFTFAGIAGGMTGASADPVVSLTAGSGVSTDSYQSSVTLADGPDLVITTPEPAVGITTEPTAQVSAGTSYNRSLKFTNYGDVAAQGVTVEVSTFGYGVDIPELRKGCEYEAPYTADCYIPDLIAPGASETLTPAFQFLTTTDLMWQTVQLAVVPGYASLQPYTTGAGKAFSLTDSTGAAQVPVTGQTSQSGIESTSVWTANLQVGSATADYAAQASLFQQSDDGFDLQAGVANNGAGYINLGLSAEYELTVDVTIPSGVDAFSVQNDWVPVIGGSLDYSVQGQPGYSEYAFNAGISLAGGGQYTDGSPGQVVLEAEPGFAGGSGTVTVNVNRGALGAYGARFGTIDSDPTNDTTTFDIPAYS